MINEKVYAFRALEEGCDDRVHLQVQRAGHRSGATGSNTVLELGAFLSRIFFVFRRLL